MAYGIRFSRERASDLVCRLREGRPLDCPPGGWDKDGVVMLAAAFSLMAWGWDQPGEEELDALQEVASSPEVTSWLAGLLTSLEHGESVQPAEAGWTKDCLSMAFFCCMRMATALGPYVEFEENDCWESLSPQERKVDEDSLLADVCAAISAYRHFIGSAVNGSYDLLCDPEILAVVGGGNEGICLVQGCRHRGDGE